MVETIFGGGEPATPPVSVVQLFVEGIIPLIILFVLTAVPLVFGLRALYDGTVQARQTAAVWASDTIPIGEVPDTDGTVEIEGTAQKLSDTVEAEYSGTECLAYRYEKHRREDEDDSWQRVDYGETAVPFLVADDSGEVVVDPGGASRSFEQKYRDTDLTGHRDERKTEDRLEAGDTVHVYGQKRTATSGNEYRKEGDVFVGDGDDVRFQLREGSELGAVASGGLRTVLTFVMAGVALAIVLGVTVSGIAEALWNTSSLT
ncbi:hypothetical protein AArcSl_0923 [Halalkaliarchaeum desulfuricum]|uniref:RING-type E3 ubiquitin transferase n=1 Tax=Halalkaliarchaeum desulfuricum TaxID=2055893 RepID=A0A343THI9_9EURY|nr:hypothetical protein [Halalkaliarchaeum desulfuricum]AUX08561.1 hypothetical protein AArcSl_0923 [Halalkaliarchaeum desulfuricum]